MPKGQSDPGNASLKLLSNVSLGNAKATVKANQHHDICRDTAQQTTKSVRNHCFAEIRAVGVGGGNMEAAQCEIRTRKWQANTGLEMFAPCKN